MRVPRVQCGKGVYRPWGVPAALAVVVVWALRRDRAEREERRGRHQTSSPTSGPGVGKDVAGWFIPVLPVRRTGGPIHLTGGWHRAFCDARRPPTMVDHRLLATLLESLRPWRDPVILVTIVRP